jgi:hypothetical protein
MVGGLPAPQLENDPLDEGEDEERDVAHIVQGDEAA